MQTNDFVRSLMVLFLLPFMYSHFCLKGCYDPAFCIKDDEDDVLNADPVVFGAEDAVLPFESSFAL